MLATFVFQAARMFLETVGMIGISRTQIPWTPAKSFLRSAPSVLRTSCDTSRSISASQARAGRAWPGCQK